MSRTYRADPRQGSIGLNAERVASFLLHPREAQPGGTLDVTVQHSFDQGATWFDCAHLAQLSSGAPAAAYDINTPSNDATARPVAQSTAGASAPVLTAGSVVPGPWGDVLRLVSVTGAGVTASTPITVTVLSLGG